MKSETDMVIDRAEEYGCRALFGPRRFQRLFELLEIAEDERLILLVEEEYGNKTT